MTHTFTSGDYIIEQGPSIYSARNNATTKLDDIRIWHAHGKGWGTLINRRLYATVAVVYCESGAVRRGINAIPFTPDQLRKWGFDLTGEYH